MRGFLGMMAMGLLVGCGGGDIKAAGSQPCSSSSPVSSAAPSGLSSFEEGLVGPLLADVRAGVQPWSEESIGLCRGQGRDCPEFLGASADELPPGEYMVRAELKVPQVGAKGSWRVRMETQCTTTRRTANGESTSSSSSSKEYDVQYAGTEHGSRLSPLLTIRSPEPSGAKSCTYTLTSLHPDRPMEWKGSWSVPQS